MSSYSDGSTFICDLAFHMALNIFICPVRLIFQYYIARQTAFLFSLCCILYSSCSLISINFFKFRKVSSVCANSHSCFSLCLGPPHKLSCLIFKIIFLRNILYTISVLNFPLPMAPSPSLLPEIQISTTFSLCFL